VLVTSLNCSALNKKRELTVNLVNCKVAALHLAVALEDCVSCLIYADFYGASQELLLEAIWKTQDRKIAEAAKDVQ
jgi:hypothetical protein